MSVENTRKVMTQYFNSEHADVSMMTEDVVFTIMATGQEHHGPSGVAQMLQCFYHVAFEATAETKNAFLLTSRRLSKVILSARILVSSRECQPPAKQCECPYAWCTILKTTKSRKGGSISKYRPCFSSLRLKSATACWAAGA